MWQSSIRGLILHQIDFTFLEDPADTTDRLYVEAVSAVNKLPWFHQLPVFLLASLTTFVCLLRYGSTLDRLNSDRRNALVAKFAALPAFALLVKLIGSIALLHFYDSAIPAKRSGT